MHFALEFTRSHTYVLGRMEGFVVFDYVKQYPEARKELAQWLSEGKIQRKETIVRGGLANAEKALTDLYNGVNTGTLGQEEDEKPFRKSGHTPYADCCKANSL